MQPSFYCVFQRVQQQYSVWKWYMYVLRDETIRKSVQAVDEKQDIFLLWPIKHPSLHFGRI